MKDNTIKITANEGEINLIDPVEELNVLPEEKPTPKASKDKPELVSVNHEALRDLDRHLDYAKRTLQAIYDQYLKDLGSPPTMEEIQSWFGERRSNFLVPDNAKIKEGILLKKYMEQRAKHPSLYFSIDNVILPDLENLYEICGQLIFNNWVDKREVMYWQCYQIVRGRVELIPKEVDIVKSQWQVYATTNEEKARLALVRKICDIMDEIKLFNPDQLNIPGFIKWDAEAGQYIPLQYYIKGNIK